MVRFLYGCILGMHPVAFREGFADEMLWIFDELEQSRKSFSLLIDCLVSLLRQ